MTVEKAAKELNLEEVLTPPEHTELQGGYTSDLLSDVMGNASEGEALITIQAHKNTVAVATLVGSPAIIICNARQIPEDMIQAAAQENIALYRTEENQFTVSGKLFRLLNSK
ncbi:hypothetical protein [Spirochaeta lutea]|uniref:HPr(Ser) kinase/phosphorylase N-terminal domain-containing protein n=1 Tax=Spirochaeta lutea TaxID=1480694 RepID=A0A098R0T4_9SPIO|nr:hypothetical protein [Spirochaeta lutea]KGE73341.1 hypothetical protein DC28_04225 [Spirochaeta lutea]